MRRSFNGLYAHVQTVLAQDPLSGYLFLFTNKPRTRVKVMLWDGSGLWVCAKRLERYTFGWPQSEGDSAGGKLLSDGPSFGISTHAAAGFCCKIPLQSNRRNSSRHIAYYQQWSEGTERVTFGVQ